MTSPRPVVRAGDRFFPRKLPRHAPGQAMAAEAQPRISEGRCCQRHIRILPRGLRNPGRRGPPPWFCPVFSAPCSNRTRPNHSRGSAASPHGKHAPPRPGSRPAEAAHRADGVLEKNQFFGLIVGNAVFRFGGSSQPRQRLVRAADPPPQYVLARREWLFLTRPRACSDRQGHRRAKIQPAPRVWRERRVLH